MGWRMDKYHLRVYSCLLSWRVVYAVRKSKSKGGKYIYGLIRPDRGRYKDEGNPRIQRECRKEVRTSEGGRKDERYRASTSLGERRARALHLYWYTAT